MEDKDFLQNLQAKVLELKQRRNEMTSKQLEERQRLGQIEEQEAKIKQEKIAVLARVQSKEATIKKYDDLIKQSEDALEKIYNNSQRLNEALNQVLNDNNL